MVKKVVKPVSIKLAVIKSLKDKLTEAILKILGETEAELTDKIHKVVSKVTKKIVKKTDKQIKKTLKAK